MSGLTPFHSKYFAELLKRRMSSDNIEKFASTLLDAKVELKPHQVEAALFAFRNPLSKGAILADEVGLGKTIEAGLVIAQKWAEERQHILVIVPSSLRHQWYEELTEKFYIPCEIIESKKFNETKSQGVNNPFITKSVIISSYQFIAKHAELVSSVPWDLIVIDEAHKLRNVYKASSIIANRIKLAIGSSPKLFLSATPLQNTILELYGLTSLVDEKLFGDLKAFRTKYSRLLNTDDIHGANPMQNMEDLKARLSTVMIRTLRKDVKEFTPYTNRIAKVEEFIPTDEEQKLYELVNEYLQRDDLQALPASQRTLITLQLRKLLASSSFAVAQTLRSLVKRLGQKIEDSDEMNDLITQDLAHDIDGLEDIEEEWSEEEEANKLLEPKILIDEKTKELIEIEQKELTSYAEKAEKITENAKGKALEVALKKGFEELDKLGAPKKALIFTESRRTQEYLYRLLLTNGYLGKVVLFNGSNADSDSKEIYEKWLSKNIGSDRVTNKRDIDKRTAIVDAFKGNAEIMIATEAAAEGINLQFCSLVINYDLPWNPQRVEQRIGRCHRFGQKFDVVVINFVNLKNLADQRVYELLNLKFNLFHGVFGSSDQVLGAIESGVDIEKHILRIYQQCRTSEQINKAFNELQSQLEHKIKESINQTERKILENFDQEVLEKIKADSFSSQKYIDQYQQYLWNVARFELQAVANFDESHKSFKLFDTPIKNDAPCGEYRLTKDDGNYHRFRLLHPLAQYCLQHAISRILLPSQLSFDYQKSGMKITKLEKYVGTKGYCQVDRVTASTFEQKDELLLTAVTDSGEILTQDEAKRLMQLSADVDEILVQKKPPVIDETVKQNVDAYLSELRLKDQSYLHNEMIKLNKWEEDRKFYIHKEMQDLRKRKIELQNELTHASDKLTVENIDIEYAKVTKILRQKRLSIDEIEDQIETETRSVITRLRERMIENVSVEHIFSFSWDIH